MKSNRFASFLAIIQHFTSGTGGGPLTDNISHSDSEIFHQLVIKM